MESFAPHGPVYQAGTLSGNPLAMAAGLATLEHWRPGGYHELEETEARAGGGPAGRRPRRREPVKVARPRGLLTLFFANDPVGDSAAALRRTPMLRALLPRHAGPGVYFPPSQFEAWFPSLEHDDECVRMTLDAARETLTEIFTEGGCHVR